MYIETLKILARMFFDNRKSKVSRHFHFRPRFWRSDKLYMIDLATNDKSFRSRVFLRPRTSDINTFEQIFLSGEYSTQRLSRSKDISDLYKSIERPLILDLGANIGLASIYLQSAWPKARIIAVEPHSHNIALLRKNAPLVTSITAAISSERGHVSIVNPEEPAWSYRTQRASAGDIPTVTVSNILEDNPEYSPFMCKIDIEGAEEELFSKNLGWVQHFPVIVIELHERLLARQAASRNFLKAVSGLNRDFVLDNEIVWSISNGPIS